MNRTAAHVLLVAVCLPAMAADPSAAVVDRVVACTSVADNLARLTCFDQVAAPLAASRLPAPAPAPAPASVPLPSFGEEQLRDKPTESSGESSLQAHIASTRRGGQGTYLVTLDNGQVWRHEEGSQADYFVAGKAVTITRAAMGSYRLTLSDGKSKNWVRVTRVR